MPSDRVHVLVGMAFLPIFTYVILKIGLPVLTFIVTYVFSLFWLSPDLDLANSESMKRWGILRFVWIPYARIFRHRGVSHSILLGSLTRLLYLFAIATMPAYFTLKTLEQHFHFSK